MELINELAEQSGIYNSTVTITAKKGEEAESEELVLMDLKIFAELIVLKCVQTIIDNSRVPHDKDDPDLDFVDWGYQIAVKECVNNIKQHFGVE
jgi:hypothetical protein